MIVQLRPIITEPRPRFHMQPCFRVRSTRCFRYQTCDRPSLPEETAKCDRRGARSCDRNCDSNVLFCISSSNGLPPDRSPLGSVRARCMHEGTLVTVQYEEGLSTYSRKNDSSTRTSREMVLSRFLMDDTWVRYRWRKHDIDLTSILDRHNVDMMSIEFL